MENIEVKAQTGKEKTMGVEAPPQLNKLAQALGKPTPPALPSLKTPVSGQRAATSLFGIEVIPTLDSNGTVIAIKVNLSGEWEGKWVKGVIRQIEREYRLIKNNATRKVVQQSVDARRALTKTKE